MKNLNSNGAKKIISLASILMTILFIGGCGLSGDNQAVSPVPTAPTTGVNQKVNQATNQGTNQKANNATKQAIGQNTNQTTTLKINQKKDLLPKQPVAEVSTHAVDIKNLAFKPVSLTVKSGDTVTWTNNDSVPHQIIAGTFSSKIIPGGQTYSYTVQAAGTYNYSCAIHPSMKGTIIVQ